MVLVLSIGSTAALLIAAVAYYLGSPARIASDYTSIATPANRALSAELAGYTSNRSHDLVAARSALMNEVKTLGSFDDQLAAVTFPSTPAAAADSLTQADQALAKAIGRQARAPSLSTMQSLEGDAESAAETVKIQVARIREALGLSPSSGPLY
jgi:hypothetical protein